nr:MAG TPA: hypothetical protein [Caudoviricetes sp.]
MTVRVSLNSGFLVKMQLIVISTTSSTPKPDKPT